MTSTANDQTAIGANLRRRREAMGWSRATLASRSGTSEPTIARAELYGVRPRLATLELWAGAFGITVSDLLADEAQPEAVA